MIKFNKNTKTGCKSSRRETSSGYEQTDQIISVGSLLQKDIDLFENDGGKT